LLEAEIKVATRDVIAVRRLVWVAYVKRQLGIATQLSVIKGTVAKNRNSVSLNNLSLHRPIDTKFSILVAYVEMQLGITTQVSVFIILLIIVITSLLSEGNT